MPIIDLQAEHERAKRRVAFLLGIRLTLSELTEESNSLSKDIDSNPEFYINLACEMKNVSREELNETIEFHKTYLQNKALGIRLPKDRNGNA